MRPNKYAGRCGCGTFVTPGQGTIDKISGRWVVFCATCRVPSYAGAAPEPAAGPDLGGGEDYACTDRGYEDQCAAACGRGL